MRLPRFVAVSGLLIAAVAASRLQLTADEPPSDEDSLRESAKTVYEGLLSELQASPRVTVPDVETVAEWSNRIMIAELSPYLQLMESAPKGVVPPLVDGERLRDSLLEHSGRMKSLERIVGAKVKAGAASQTELAAARFFRLEIDALLAKADKEARRLMDSIEIPEPDLDESLDGHEKMTVVIDANSDIWLDEKKFSLEDLKEEFGKFTKRHEKTAVILLVDPASKHTTQIAIFDAANASGMKILLASAESATTDKP